MGLLRRQTMIRAPQKNIEGVILTDTRCTGSLAMPSRDRSLFTAHVACSLPFPV
jgi:hypothetical protein